MQGGCAADNEMQYRFDLLSRVINGESSLLFDPIISTKLKEPYKDADYFAHMRFNLIPEYGQYGDVSKADNLFVGYESALHRFEFGYVNSAAYRFVSNSSMYSVGGFGLYGETAYVLKKLLSESSYNGLIVSGDLWSDYNGYLFNKTNSLKLNYFFNSSGNVSIGVSYIPNLLNTVNRVGDRYVGSSAFYRANAYRDVLSGVISYKNQLGGVDWKVVLSGDYAHRDGSDSGVFSGDGGDGGFSSIVLGSQVSYMGLTFTMSYGNRRGHNSVSKGMMARSVNEHYSQMHGLYGLSYAFGPMELGLSRFTSSFKNRAGSRFSDISIVSNMRLQYNVGTVLYKMNDWCTLSGEISNFRVMDAGDGRSGGDFERVKDGKIVILGVRAVF